MTANQPTTNPYTEGQSFLAAAINNPSLINGYVTAIKNGNGNPQAGTTWLTQNGYQTTSLQVYQALLFGLQNELGFWQGVYGLSQLSDPSNSNNTQNGPVLTIAIDSNTGNAYPILGGSIIPTSDFTFTPGTNTSPYPSLSFTVSQYGYTYGVNITFYYYLPFTISPPLPNPIPSNFSGGNYTVESVSGGGTWFQGTITINGTQWNYIGELGQPVSFPLSFWTGYYGTTTFTPSGSSQSSQGQALILQPDGSGGFTVTVGGETIQNWTYNCALNQLAWTTTNNSTAGNLTFLQVQPSGSSTYNGPGFTGTYTDGGTTYTYNGILSTPKSLNQWVGSYGVTVLSPSSSNDDSDDVLGPELNLYLSNNSPQVQINFGNNQIATIPPSAIDSFDQATNTLTWTSSSGINTSGQIQFGQQTAATSSSSYIGNYFNGSLTLSTSVGSLNAGSYSYSGQIGEPPPSSTSPAKQPFITWKQIEQGIAMGFFTGIGMKVFEGLFTLFIELPAKWLYSKISSLVTKKSMNEENAPSGEDSLNAEEQPEIEQKSSSGGGSGGGESEQGGTESGSGNDEDDDEDDDSDSDEGGDTTTNTTTTTSTTTEGSPKPLVINEQSPNTSQSGSGTQFEEPTNTGGGSSNAGPPSDNEIAQAGEDTEQTSGDNDDDDDEDEDSDMKELPFYGGGEDF